MSAVFRSPTIAELADQVRDFDPSRASTSVTDREGHFLSVLQEGTGSTTVICVGGQVTKLVPRFPEDVTVLGIGYDGVQAQPYLGLRAEDLARVYADEILTHPPTGRTTVVGFCYAGLLTYALAHSLRDRGVSDFNVVMIEPSTRSGSANLGGVSSARQPIRLSGVSLRAMVPRVYRSVRFRAGRLWTGLQIITGQTVSPDRRWDYYSNKMMENIRFYRPTRRLPGTVHLVCGKQWLSRYESVWATEYLESPPVIHEAGDFSHLELTDLSVPADIWVKLVHRLSLEQSR